MRLIMLNITTGEVCSAWRSCSSPTHYLIFLPSIFVLAQFSILLPEHSISSLSCLQESLSWMLGVCLPKIAHITTNKTKYLCSHISYPFFFHPPPFFSLSPPVCSGLQTEPQTCRCVAGRETRLLPTDRPTNPQK